VLIGRYILTELAINAPTFSELERYCKELPETPQPFTPQPLKASKSGLTIALWGDEDYKPDSNEPQSQKGGRHRVIVESEDGKPRRIRREIQNLELLSKL